MISRTYRQKTTNILNKRAKVREEPEPYKKRVAKKNAKGSAVQIRTRVNSRPSVEEDNRAQSNEEIHEMQTDDNEDTELELRRNLYPSLHSPEDKAGDFVDPEDMSSIFGLGAAGRITATE
jgi:hypothetical protein